MATFEDFQKLDIRVGKIIEVKDFPEARKPSYKLKIDLGHEIGVKKSCAQLPQNYKSDELVGKQVLCKTSYLRIFLTKATVKNDIRNKPTKPSIPDIHRITPVG